MKKIQLLKGVVALSLVLGAAVDVAQAANVYSKDGTTLNVNGRIRARFSNGDTAVTLNSVGDGDSSLKNNARFGLDGVTKANDYVSAYFYTQWDTTDGNDRDHFFVRDQYVGLDFNDFGKFTFGRYLSPVYYVLSGTDVHLDFTGNQLGDNNRRGGQIKYTWSGYGAEINLAYQTAIDGIKVSSAEAKSLDVDSGFSASVGYTFNDVVFGPLSVKLGYEYFNAQEEKEYTGKTNNHYLDNLSVFAAGITWGTYASGPYAALSYSKNDYDTYVANEDYTVEGFESVFGYGLDNGIYADIGYVWQQFDSDKAGAYNKLTTGGIQVVAGYKVTPQFIVDVETYFNTSSDGKGSRKATIDSEDKATYYKALYSKDQKAVTLNAVYFL